MEDEEKEEEKEKEDRLEAKEWRRRRNDREGPGERWRKTVEDQEPKGGGRWWKIKNPKPIDPSTHPITHPSNLLILPCLPLDTPPQLFSFWLDS